MFHKREKEYRSADVPPEKRLKANIGDLFLANQISGQRAQELFEDANAAGLTQAKELCKGLGSDYAVKLGRNPNAARDLSRRLLKRCLWPPVYFASIPVLDLKKQTETTIDLPFLLPHELIRCMGLHACKKDLLQRSGMCEASLAHLLKMEQEFDASAALGVGLWIDGTPYSYDRLLSLESVVLNFPGLGESSKGLRLPITVIPKHFCIKFRTFDCILGVAEWKVQPPLEHWELMDRIMLRGMHISQVFGSSKPQRIKELYKKLQQYYSSDGHMSTDSRLSTLTETMIRKTSTSSPKLRCKAAEARALVPFVLQLCQEAFPPNACTEKEACIREAAVRLQACYAMLQNDRYNQEALVASCTQFCLLVKALRDPEACLWKIKPKHHGALEVCLQQGSPSLTWTYRDEDMGGYLASLARLKGGSHNPRSVAFSVLQRWRAKGLPHLNPSS
ncbi:unnamed protein product [Symbiodinium sp. KB8]|nr:unnamed protein product [Symbiodinium sp. KB8]